jgi:hypothetical protein
MGSEYPLSALSCCRLGQTADIAVLGGTAGSAEPFISAAPIR